MTVRKPVLKITPNNQVLDKPAFIKTPFNNRIYTLIKL